MTKLSLALVIPLLLLACSAPQKKVTLPSEQFKQLTDDNEKLQRENVWLKRQLDSIKALLD